MSWRNFVPRPDEWASTSTQAAALAKCWEFYVDNNEFPAYVCESDVNALMYAVAADERFAARGDVVAGEFDARYTLQSCGHYALDTCGECDSCQDCCSCITCDSCGDRCNDDYCGECEACSHCCNCVSCGDCGRTVTSSGCTDCERCYRCGCECSAFEERESGPPIRDGKQRLCGVEWEFNRADDAGPINRWADRWSAGMHEDGSCGWEAVTPPIAGKHIAACLSGLGKAFNSAKAKIDEHCGLHVHVDAGDLYWADMYRLLACFAHVEPVMYALCGQKRMNNTYSPPSAQLFRTALASADRKEAIMRIVGGRIQGRYGIDKKSGGRYRSLNICPWLARMRGSRSGRGKRAADCTVEFRMHRNTDDAARVIGWAQLCVAIVDWVSRASDADATRIQGMSALQALCVMAPNSRAWILSRLKQWRNATSFTRGNGRAKRLISFQPGKGWTAHASA